MTSRPRRYHWKSLLLDRLEDDALDAMVASASERPSPSTLVVLRHLGGAVARVPQRATAYPHRSALYDSSFDSIWKDPAEHQANVAWTRTAWNLLRPYSTGGVYLNFAGLEDEARAPLQAAHGENLARLREVRARHDPGAVFGGP